MRELASVPTIPQLHTRWYSPLDFVSLRRTPEPPTFTPKELKQRRVYDVDEDAQLVGTIFVGSLDMGRRALRPQPSMDWNDPLVCHLRTKLDGLLMSRRIGQVGRNTGHTS